MNTLQPHGVGDGEGGRGRKGGGAFALKKSGRAKQLSGKNHVQFGHFVNFCMHILSGKNVLPRKGDLPHTPMASAALVLLQFSISVPCVASSQPSFPF